MATTLLASKQLALRPRLLTKIRVVLDGIVETAIEARKLHDGMLSTELRFWTRVDGHTVWYTLDLDRQVATILGVGSADDSEGR